MSTSTPPEPGTPGLKLTPDARQALFLIINAALVALAVYLSNRTGVKIDPPQISSTPVATPLVIVVGGSGAPAPVSVTGGK